MAAEIHERTQYDWFAEAKVLENQGEFEQALEAYAESLKIDPEFAKSWFYKAKLHYQLGQMDLAKDCVKRTLELAPEWKHYVDKYMPDLKY
ncbi:MAG: tetratricopeptide repeat protein [Candidatus Thorarchaeota archaeon]